MEESGGLLYFQTSLKCLEPIRLLYCSQLGWSDASSHLTLNAHAGGAAAAAAFLQPPTTD